MTDVATAYVRLRPNAAGFKREADAQVHGALAGIGKTAAFAIGAAGIAEGVKNILEAAAGKQSAIAQARQTVKNAGADWKVYGKTVEDVLDEQENRTGFDFEEQAQAFGRLLQQVKSTPKALAILATAEDVARARHLGLAQVAVALSRAYAGNAQSLSRLGIVIPKVTAQQDVLKGRLLEITHAQTAQTQAKAKDYAGTINLTDAERELAKLSPIQLQNLAEQTKAQEGAAAAADKRQGSESAIAEVTRRYSGQAAAYAKTAAGAYDLFRVALQQVEEEVGARVLPKLTELAKGATNVALSLSENESFLDGVSAGMDGIAGGAEAIVTAFHGIEPVLKAVAQAAQAVGPGPILATYAAYKSLMLIQGASAAVSAKYDTIVKAGIAVQEARVAALAEQATAEATAAAVRSAAERAELLRLQVLTVGMTEREAASVIALETTLADTEALLANGLALEEVAAANVAAAAAAEAQTVSAVEQTVAMGGMRAAGTGMLSMLMGPQALIAGVALLAGGLYYLSTRTSETERNVDALTGAFERQTKAAKDARTAKDEAQKDTNALPSLLDQRAKAVEEIDKAQGKLAQDALSGHATRKQLADDATAISVANAHWRDTNKQVIDTEHDKKQRILDGKTAIREQATAAKDAVTEALKLAPAARKAHPGIGEPGQARQDAQQIKDVYNDLYRSADDADKKLSVDQRTRIRALADRIKELGHTPTRAQIDVILNTGPAVAQLQEFKDQLLGPVSIGGKLPEAAPGARGDVAAPVVVHSKGGDRGLKKDASDAANEWSTQFVQTIDASGIATALADAVAGAQSQIVGEASTLAGTIGSVLDARLAATEKTIDAADARIQARIAARSAAATARSTAQATDDAALKLRQLQETLGTGPLTAEQTLQLQAAKNAALDAQDAVANAKDQADSQALSARKTVLEQQNEMEKTASSRRLADLTDELNRGVITQATYVARVRALLAKEHVGYRSTGKLLGRAFADGFESQLSDVIAQAKDIVPSAKPTGTKAISPAKAEADAIQAFIDSVKGSGGRFHVTGAETLPKGVTIGGLIAAATSQRTDEAYRVKSDQKQDTAIHYAGLTTDHAKGILDELRKPKPVHVTVVVDDSAKKRKIAQRTR